MDLHIEYPWLTKHKPVVVSAPMMRISLAHYALATSAAGGLGFLAGGFDLATLEADLEETESLLQSKAYPNLDLRTGLLPIGVGIQNWSASKDVFISVLKSHPVAAVWFFGPKRPLDLVEWADAVRSVNPAIKVWIQIGSVAEVRELAPAAKPDVFVVQGSDAGGHGLSERASIITLLPEIQDALRGMSTTIPLVAAGGIVDGRTAASALALGADGICMGTRFLASHEANISKGYQNEVLRANDGGVSTVMSKVYDVVRGIKGWPSDFGGRGVINQSYIDSQNGMSDTENERLYQEEMKKGDQGWGPEARMTTYAGTGVGLVSKVSSIEDIVHSTQDEAMEILQRIGERYRNQQRDEGR